MTEATELPNAPKTMTGACECHYTLDCWFLWFNNHYYYYNTICPAYYFIDCQASIIRLGQLPGNIGPISGQLPG